MFPQVLSYFVRKVQKYDREVVEDGTSALNPCHCKVLVEQPVNPRKQVIGIHTLWGGSTPLSSSHSCLAALAPDWRSG